MVWGEKGGTAGRRKQPKGEPFTSLENFRNRTKAPQSNVFERKWKELGIMGDLSDTDQLSFDFL